MASVIYALVDQQFDHNPVLCFTTGPSPQLTERGILVYKAELIQKISLLPCVINLVDNNSQLQEKFMNIFIVIYISGN